MKTYLIVFLFFLSNAIGSTIGPILFHLTVNYNIDKINSSNYDLLALQNDMVFNVMTTWLICALFSFSVFFLSGIWQKIFLCTPIIVPLLYGILLLQTYH